MLRLNPALPYAPPPTRQHHQAHSPASRLRSGNELSPELSYTMLKTYINVLYDYMKSKTKDSPRGQDRWDAILSQINSYVKTIIQYNDQCGDFIKDDPEMLEILEELRLLYPQLLEKKKKMTAPNFDMEYRGVPKPNN